MADYALHMKMVGFLHGLYPKVHISLHAGELAEGLVPPEGLCCHIRLAVEDAPRRAHRPRRGRDARRPPLRPAEGNGRQTRDGGNQSHQQRRNSRRDRQGSSIPHLSQIPRTGRAFHPTMKECHATTSRMSTCEPSKPMRLSYADLKQMVRTGLEHNFLPGESLWRERDNFTRTGAACASDVPGSAKPSAKCAEFLKSSEKARHQWELEHRFREFDASL